jgi:hypothetical protein
MSFLRSNSKLVTVALSCLAIGAGASAIASAGAATGKNHVVHLQNGVVHARRVGARGWFAAHRGMRARMMGAAAHAVQGTITIATKHGFKTVSFTRGTVDSVSGSQLTLTEGNRPTAHRNVTLTIPAAAKVRDNRRASTLSALKAGQRVIVVNLPKRTVVIAHTARRG